MIYCKDCKFRVASNLRSDVSFCTYYNHPLVAILGCDSGKSNIITNADRFFRNATNEQLAQYMDKIASCEFCPARRERCVYGHGCIDAWLEWLKQEDGT